jgi:hypothetical protein
MLFPCSCRGAGPAFASTVKSNDMASNEIRWRAVISDGKLTPAGWLWPDDQTTAIRLAPAGEGMSAQSDGARIRTAPAVGGRWSRSGETPIPREKAGCPEED